MKISFIIYVINSINKDNIISLYFIKYKQVKKSILAIKLYKIAYNFDIAAIIKAILTNLLKIKIILIFFINLKFFYNYFVKLEIT